MPVKFIDYGFTYALNPVPALSSVNLTIYPGEIVVLCGASGSGKSTLLRCMKKAITPAGVRCGVLTGLPADTDIAVVFQNPETQLVTASMLNDLVFQMENRGMHPFTMKKRMSETVGFFGLEAWLRKPVQSLSGGQKQLTALCAAMMCEPQLLLLDEPISQLDPLAAEAFLANVKKINREWGVTVVMAEHRLDECADMADRIVFMAEGRVRQAGSTEETLRFLFQHGFAGFLPQIPQASMQMDGGMVLTPRAFKEKYPAEKWMAPKKCAVQDQARGSKRKAAVHKKNSKEHKIISLTDISVSYPNAERPVLNRLSLDITRDEFLCLLGGNGSGKTTLLKLIAGLIKPGAGRRQTKIKHVGYMPQHIRDYFLRERVADEIVNPNDPYTQKLAARLGVTEIFDKNPFDISGGEQQRAVLLAILSRKPELMVLDEPTKGMDPLAKRELAALLREAGIPVVIATHDMEFAALYARRCAMLFDGEIAYADSPRGFFSGNLYYTTAIHKAVRHLDASAIVLSDALALRRHTDAGAVE